VNLEKAGDWVLVTDPGRNNYGFYNLSTGR
jgi:hypothetical protein